MIDKAKLALVQELREHDHGFIGVDGVEHFAKGFGVELHAYKHTADGDRNPKGLTLADGAKNAVGMDAAEMAEDICRALHVGYAPMMGRGSRLRSCCDALEKHYG